jgi:hypothetical protein
LVDGVGLAIYEGNIFGEKESIKHFGCCLLGCDRQVGNLISMYSLNTKSYLDSITHRAILKNKQEQVMSNLFFFPFLGKHKNRRCHVEKPNLTNIIKKKEMVLELTISAQVQIFVTKNSSNSCLPPSIMVMPVKIHQ